MTELSEPVVLKRPVIRGEGEAAQTIAEVVVRMPTAGDLRGLSWAQLLKMDIATMSTALSRVTQPVLDAHELTEMHPRDHFALSTTLLAFFISGSERRAAGL